MSDDRKHQCKNCRWWHRERYPSDDDTGTCSRIVASGGDIPHPRIFPVTSGAYLETPPTFGCALWEPKVRES